MLDLDQLLSFRFFLKIAFVREISSNSQAVMGTTGMNRLNNAR